MWWNPCPFNVHSFSLSFKTGVAACDDSHTATWGGGLAHILSLPSCISGGTGVNTCEKVAVKSDPLRESVEAYLFKLRLGQKSCNRCLETKTCRPHRRGHEALQKSWIETCYRILLKQRKKLSLPPNEPEKQLNWQLCCYFDTCENRSWLLQMCSGMHLCSVSVMVMKSVCCVARHLCHN